MPKQSKKGKNKGIFMKKQTRKIRAAKGGSGNRSVQYNNLQNGHLTYEASMPSENGYETPQPSPMDLSTILLKYLKSTKDEPSELSSEIENYKLLTTPGISNPLYNVSGDTSNHGIYGSSDPKNGEYGSSLDFDNKGDLGYEPEFPHNEQMEGEEVYGLLSEYSGTDNYDDLQNKPLQSINYRNKPLLFYFMFHNINKYNLMIVRNKQTKRIINLMAGKYCLETIYNNSKFEAFDDRNSDYTFDNSINSEFLSNLKRPYFKSDYSHDKSTSLLLNYYADGENDNRIKQSVFDENFIRLVYYLYETDTPFFNFLNPKENDTFSKIIKIYKEPGDFNLSRLFSLIPPELNGKLGYYFYSDKTPIQHYFKLDSEADKDDYLNLIAFLSETKKGSKKKGKLINDSNIGFRLEISKLIRDFEISIDLNSNKTRLLHTNELLNLRLNDNENENANKEFNFTLAFKFNVRGNTEVKTSEKLKVTKTGDIVYNIPPRGDENIFTELKLDNLNNIINDDTIKQKFAHKLRLLNSSKNGAFGVEVFKIFSLILKDNNITRLFDILQVLTSDNPSDIFVAYNYIYLEQNLPKIKGIGLINSDYDIYTKNKLGKIKMRTDLSNKQINDFFILDLECEYGDDNCGPKEYDNSKSTKSYFSSKPHKPTKTAENKINNLLSDNKDIKVGGRNYILRQEIWIKSIKVIEVITVTKAIWY